MSAKDRIQDLIEQAGGYLIEEGHYGELTYQIRHGQGARGTVCLDIRGVRVSASHCTSLSATRVSLLRTSYSPEAIKAIRRELADLELLPWRGMTGDDLRALRKEAGVTQKAIAEYLRLPQTRVHKWEQTAHDCKLPRHEEIAYRRAVEVLSQ